jgi:catechol-2,3-dioxygenase
MNKKLDQIHHTAIQVQNISKSVSWYTENFNCKIEYQDSSWAMLEFANTSLALVLPDQHPYHFAITQNDLSIFGAASQHRDGTSSVYIKDADGNNVEMLKLADHKTIK